MVDCVINSFVGVDISGIGEIRFGATVEEVRAALRDDGDLVPRDDVVQLYFQDAPGANERQLSLRIDFDADGHCEGVDFLSPRLFPPMFENHQLSGPRVRDAAQILSALGHEPWDDDGPVDDIVAWSTPGNGFNDTLYFHSAGLSLWTEMGTETDETGDVGEYVLDTVYVWLPGLWERANERWEREGKAIRVALPPK